MQNEMTDAATYALEPHVAGECGPATMTDPLGAPADLTESEYLLDYPDTDELIESFPVVFVTEALAARLAGLEGVSFEAVTVRPGDNYAELYPGAPHKS